LQGLTKTCRDSPSAVLSETAFMVLVRVSSRSHQLQRRDAVLERVNCSLQLTPYGLH